MLQKKKVSIGLFLGLGLVQFATPASAAVPSNCTSTGYACTSYGYAGIDPYGYWRYGAKDSAGRWHNCTSYVAYVLSLISPYDSRYAHFHDATKWDTDAAAIGIPISKTPEVWDVAQWNYGHVAFVEDVVYNSSGSVAYIVTTSDNYSTNPSNLVTTRRVYYPGTSAYPDNFLHFPVISSGGGGGGGGSGLVNLYSVTAPKS